MPDIQKLRGILSAGLPLLIIYNLSFASDLIEPTRNLSDKSHNEGKLFVFSEPPGLGVKMDGTVIGETPVELQAVEPGIHVIHVKDSEIEIYVNPGKSVKISWFKGAFIKIPSEAKEGHRQQIVQKKEDPRKEKSEQSAKKMDLEPLYWPLNPKGPIY
jgi:hypothetical protein